MLPLLLFQLLVPTAGAERGAVMQVRTAAPSEITKGLADCSPRTPPGTACVWRPTGAMTLRDGPPGEPGVTERRVAVVVERFSGDLPYRGMAFHGEYWTGKGCQDDAHTWSGDALFVELCP